MSWTEINAFKSNQNVWYLERLRDLRQIVSLKIWSEKLEKKRIFSSSNQIVRLKSRNYEITKNRNYWTWIVTNIFRKSTNKLKWIYKYDMTSVQEEKVIKTDNTKVMAIRVVEFSNRGYKISEGLRSFQKSEF